LIFLIEKFPEFYPSSQPPEFLTSEKTRKLPSIQSFSSIKSSFQENFLASSPLSFPTGFSAMMSITRINWIVKHSEMDLHVAFMTFLVGLNGIRGRDGELGGISEMGFYLGVLK
jgi:hypothetical protein